MIDLLATARQAIHDAAEQLRSLPDAELVQLAMAADVMGGGKPVPTAAIRAEHRKTVSKPRAAKGASKAETRPPRGPTRFTAETARAAVLALLKKGPKAYGQLLTEMGGKSAKAATARALVVLVDEGRVKRPSKKGGEWSLT